MKLSCQKYFLHASTLISHLLLLVIKSGTCKSTRNQTWNKKKQRRKLEWIGARRKVCLHYCIQLWIIYLSINRTVTPHNINMVHGYDFTGTVTSIPLHSFLTLFAIEFSFSIFSTPFDSNLVHLIFNTWYTFHFTASSINYNLHNNDRRMN